MKKSEIFLKSKELSLRDVTLTECTPIKPSGLVTLEHAKTYGKIVELETRMIPLGNWQPLYVELESEIDKLMGL